MAVEKRYVHQWQQISGLPCDDKTKHWTEIKLTVEDLAGMIGCAPGSILISMHIERDGFSMTLTFDERQEPTCLTESSERPGGQQPGSQPT